MKRIVTDPGHGGHAPDKPRLHKSLRGAQRGGYDEADLNLEVCTTALTPSIRIDDVIMGPGDRYETAVHMCADGVISVHHNASPRPGAHGMRCFHWGGNELTEGLGHFAQGIAPGAIVRHGQVIAPTLDTYPGARAVLLWNHEIPVLLIEVCFMSNETDLAWRLGADRVIEIAEMVDKTAAEFARLLEERDAGK